MPVGILLFHIQLGSGVGLMRWLTLCQHAWDLYDRAVKSGKWASYLKHRKSCKECRVEER